MKSFAAILVILSLVGQAALAAAGSVRFCISQAPTFTISFECADAETGDCCRSARPTETAQIDAWSPDDCDDCSDGAISAQDGDKAPSSPDRSVAKAPTCAPVASVWQTPERPEPIAQRDLATPPRGPPSASGAARQFADTVAFRL